LCATLDRQHPRDIFDVRLLLDQGGRERSVFECVLVYLLGHPRPVNEVRTPRMKSLEAIYHNEFIGMAITDIPLSQLEDVRHRLLKQLGQLVTDDDVNFLLSFKQGEPDWSLFPIADVDQLPAVMWKLANIRKMRTEKHAHALEMLGEALQKFKC
ncbi:MAG: nucleotidyl transferase AbiEii/AbiGii toxin family protein, partial [Corynebacterium sp.]|uniref:nucleotidyl transferase AbiEii/AbiGii toxin family protein n=1 Tax=Corynebacterium sp. TaxID=1720 RepID=UPI0017C39E92